MKKACKQRVEDGVLARKPDGAGTVLAVGHFAEAAALAADSGRPSPRDAEVYARIAEAADWEIRVFGGRRRGGAAQ